MSSKGWQDQCASDDSFLPLRRRMVTQQLERRGIRDARVLEAMRSVPRHLFVPERYHALAYDDSPIAIGFGQTVSQPYIVAYMLEALKLIGIEKVLEIGTGSGYEAALLSHLCEEVYSVEIIPELAARAAKTLAELNYTNVHVRCTDGYKGWPEAAPFDRIILSAAPTHVPERLVEQLAPGGIMILPLGDLDQHLVHLTKTAAGNIERTQSLPVKFVPMTGLSAAMN
ncbi:MAG: protein-L-isoaspartate(D-aspartate) O-methyltransferase [candidate division KSB1 bacterium]|nr:protein-L-isoaspartate(D-aspartate) O-methyltransferase [candidate division KSB1 bacterium]MDZ7272637.1 protein-L-isoaspartate(D-aspartate) O-methyltransferase [candidate division KSB1 bacterium]MDZ7284341.1 protein-L-isoaspartate(D-aspartate) O-methyltransferase [candidate division KSB1 bacterium]MDZ7297263.1 protein-L-isoaspartate(D-aspartate) O-methyltransferase [candidate division KSB1 bacterium]MDZ7307561.1 protein-L-isoaspartate(D-aspartate) O-methyltransferase [candidate division KSB1